MRSKRGFTLVELLAVIIVLGIILVIAIPSIAGILKGSAKRTFEVDAKEVLKAIDFKRIEYPSFNPLIITKENMNEQIGIDSSQYAQITIRVEDRNVSLVIVGADKWDGLVAYGDLDDMNVVESGEYDAIPPAITILGDNPANISKGSTYTDPGATATDTEDGSVPIASTVIKNASNQIVESIDTSIYSTYTITYTAVDSKGNSATSIRIVNIVDKTAPVITILGSNPISINVGGTYSDSGATALDNVDGNVTSKIVITGTVNPSIVGTYAITYTVKDSANNQTTVTRTVNVIDNVIPTVAFGTNGNSTYAKSRSTTITVSDNVSVNASSLKYQWTTSTTAPTEASFSTTFTNGGTISTPAGVTGGYYLWILGKDTNSNTMIARSNVFNLDNTKPIIALNGSSTVTVNKGSTYSDAGATATDAHSGVSGSVTVTGTVNPSVIGTYTVTYNVNDNAGNAATPVTRTVNVIDVLAPVITILGSNPASINLGGTYSDAGATATDDVDGNVTSRIVTTGTVNPSVIGTYTITYTVKDTANNQAVATRTVNVIDNVIPTVAFGTNGNTTYAKSRSTTVTVSDNVSVNTSSLKYQWTTSTTAPTEASFSTTFTNGGTISTPAGVTGGYYLWILAKDTSGNTMINRSNVFNLDNTVPTIAVNFNGYTVGSWTASNITMTSSGTDANSGIASYQYSSDGSVTWNTIPSSWVINWDGQWSLTFRSVDNAGNISTATTYYSVKRDATVPSTPAVNLNGYTSGTWTNQNITYSLSSTDSGSGVYKYQYSATSGYDWVDLTPGTNSRTINWETNVGFIFRAVDNVGNVSSATSAYSFMRDATAPIITLSGSNPVTISIGSTYSDAGATATDSLSGLSGSITSSSNVNPNVAGTYTVTYSISDRAGNGATATRTINVVQTVYAYGYTGATQSFSAPLSGTYQIELWGAQGGGAATGNGGYTKGRISLSANTVIYVYVGGAGTIGSASGTAQASSADNPPTFNGGGGGARGGTYNYNYRQGNSGGGATDVRLTSGAWNDTTSLRSRIMVAAGGGAKGVVTGAGEAGGLIGNPVYSYDHGGEVYYTGAGGTQTAGGAYGYTNKNYYGNNGSFGIGANGGNYAINHTYGAGGAGGGGGYYGGGSGVSSEYNVASSSGGGGSSFISGHSGCNAINSSGSATGQANHYSGYVFTSTQIIDGAAYFWTTIEGGQGQMPNPSGGLYDLGIGNSGNGYAKITYISP